MLQKLNLSSRIAPLIIASAIVLADRLSKLEIQRALASYDSIPVISGWLRIIHTENPGAAFGMLAEGNPVLRSPCPHRCLRRGTSLRRLGSLE